MSAEDLQKQSSSNVLRIKHATVRLWTRLYVLGDDPEDISSAALHRSDSLVWPSQNGSTSGSQNGSHRSQTVMNEAIAALALFANAVATPDHTLADYDFCLAAYVYEAIVPMLLGIYHRFDPDSTDEMHRTIVDGLQVSLLKIYQSGTVPKRHKAPFMELFHLLRMVDKLRDEEPPQLTSQEQWCGAFLNGWLVFIERVGVAMGATPKMVNSGLGPGLKEFGLMLSQGSVAVGTKFDQEVPTQEIISNIAAMDFTGCGDHVSAAHIDPIVLEKLMRVLRCVVYFVDPTDDDTLMDENSLMLDQNLSPIKAGTTPQQQEQVLAFVQSTLTGYGVMQMAARLGQHSAPGVRTEASKLASVMMLGIEPAGQAALFKAITDTQSDTWFRYAQESLERLTLAIRNEREQGEHVKNKENWLYPPSVGERKVEYTQTDLATMHTLVLVVHNHCEGFQNLLRDQTSTKNGRSVNLLQKLERLVIEASRTMEQVPWSSSTDLQAVLLMAFELMAFAMNGPCAANQVWFANSAMPSIIQTLLQLFQVYIVHEPSYAVMSQQSSCGACSRTLICAHTCSVWLYTHCALCVCASLLGPPRTSSYCVPLTCNVISGHRKYRTIANILENHTATDQLPTRITNQNTASPIGCDGHGE